MTESNSDDPHAVYTEESREVLRVQPSEAGEENPDIEDRIDQVASLHDRYHDTDSGLVGNILFGNSKEPVRFEMLAVSSGEDDPIEIFYSCDGQLTTLEQRLDVIYPSSFDIERETLDLGSKLITPVEYSPSEFIDELKAGNLAYDLEELLVGVDGAESPSFGGELESGLDGDVEDGLVPVEEFNNVSVPASRETETQGQDDSPDPDADVSPTQAFDQASGSEPESSEFDTKVWARNDDVPSDHRFLRLEDRDGKAIKVNPSSRLEEVDSPIDLERPTFTEDRAILARPSRDSVDPCAVRWRGKGTRKKDWMTTLRSDETAEAGEHKEYRPKPSVIAELLTQIAKMEEPLAFQIVFEARPNWKRKGMSRKEDLKKGEDTAVQSFVSTVMGPNDGSRDLPTDVQKRIELIEAKNPQRTFNVNLRAVAVNSEAAVADQEQEPDTAEDTDSSPESLTEKIESRLQRLPPAFDPLDGQYYEIDGTVVEEGSKISTGTPTTPRDELNYLLDRELTTSADEESRTESWLASSNVRSEVVMNPQELSDFITIPPGDEMPAEAFRGTRVKHEEDNPLPRPNPEILEAYSEGMSVGLPIDENRNVTSDPLKIPPDVLRHHYARFATTGHGKSVATNTDLLTLHEATDGPEILIDPKGDGMCERYLQAHFAKFGTLDDVYYFKVPDDLPAVGFFDIRPQLAQGQAREDAIQDKVDHFHEIMEMVMGDTYSNAYIAIMVLSFLIKAMFDPEYGADAFSLDDLYEQVIRMQREERVPRISGYRHEIEESLSRHSDNEEGQFKETMTAVLNRLDKLREDTHLYRLFNHVPEWDYERQQYASSATALSFHEFFEKDAVLLFDLGDVRPDPAKAMALVLLSNLWDDVRERDSDEDHTQVNLVLEEAAPFTATKLLNEMLPKARSFDLSLGLVMQYPGQVINASEDGEETFAEIQNNIHSKFYGRIADDKNISDNLATQDIDPVTIKTKLTSLRKGEWIADVSDTDWGSAYPSPFSIKAMPIPDGHPESDNPLDDKEMRKFELAQLPRCRDRVRGKYSIQRLEKRRSRGDSSSSDTVKATPEPGSSEAAGEATNQASEPEPPVGDDTESNLESDGDDRGSDILEVGPEDAPDDLFDWSDSEDETASNSGDSGDDLFVDKEPMAVEEESNESSGNVAPEPGPTDDVENPQTDDTAGDSDSKESDNDGSESIMPVDPGEADQWESAGEESSEESFLDGMSEEAVEDSQGATTSRTDVPGGQRGHPEDRSPHEVTTTPETPPAANPPSGSDIGEPEPSESHSDPETYESVDDVYEAAREINANLSGSDRFKALMELSAAAEEDGFDVDDDQLATLSGTPDESVQETLSQDTTSDQDQGESDPEEPISSESEEATWPEGSDLPPVEDQEPEDGESLSEDEPPVDDGNEPSPQREDPREYSESQRQVDDFAERVTQRYKEQPGFSEQSVEDSEITLSDDSEEFLHLILNAMNDELEDYSILSLESMNSLVKQVGDPDIERLKDLDMIEEHRVIRKRFFTVLPAGRGYLQRSLTSRDGVGDLGEKTPHKVGVAILWHYVAKHEETARVDRYQTIGGDKYDVVGYDSEGDVVVVGEAETPTNDWESIVTDYEKMADLDEEAIWLCKNHDTALEVIKALEQRGVLEEEFTPTQKKSFSTLMDAVSERELAGMDEIKAFTSLYDDLNT